VADSHVCTEEHERAVEAAARREERQEIVAWLRSLAASTREDWGLNATEEIASLISATEHKSKAEL
jgi:hypothetical protein